MSTPPSKTPAEGDPSGLGGGVRLSTIQRFVLGRRDGGFVASLLTVGLAFALGGVLIVVTTGQSPFGVYAGIFKGAGLDWLFPWVQGAEREAAAFNLQQTLLLATASGFLDACQVAVKEIVMSDSIQGGTCDPRARADGFGSP